MLYGPEHFCTLDLSESPRDLENTTQGVYMHEPAATVELRTQ